MFRWKQFIRALLAREDGPTAVEYAVMLALIVTVCISAILSIGKGVDSTADTVNRAIRSPN